MKVVFLDIDGVLVTPRSHMIRRGNFPSPTPEGISALNSITSATKAQIVITSTWRLESTLEELRRIMADWGVQGLIIDSTPVGLPSRGAEIAAWLDTWQGRHQRVESYVILDDCCDMEGALIDHLVQTDERAGLTEGDVHQAIEILDRAAAGTASA